MGLTSIDDVVVHFFFFFQAEDGIRDLTVTGVQTCALPISRGRCSAGRSTRPPRPAAAPVGPASAPARRSCRRASAAATAAAGPSACRSEEHTSELQSQSNLVCRLLLEKKKNQIITITRDYR